LPITAFKLYKNTIKIHAHRPKNICQFKQFSSIEFNHWSKT